MSMILQKCFYQTKKIFLLGTIMILILYRTITALSEGEF